MCAGLQCPTSAAFVSSFITKLVLPTAIQSGTFPLVRQLWRCSVIRLCNTVKFFYPVGVHLIGCWSFPVYLWPTYVIGQAIYIFILWFLIRRPKFTILWGHVEEILLLNKFFSDCRYMPYLRRYSRTKLCDDAQMAIFCVIFASCIFSEPRAAGFRHTF